MAAKKTAKKKTAAPNGPEQFKTLKALLVAQSKKALPRGTRVRIGDGDVTFYSKAGRHLTLSEEDFTRSALKIHGLKVSDD